MSLSNYANLQTAIITHAWRTGDTEFAAAVPDFITLAEERFNSLLRVSNMETSATVTLTNGVGTLPTDYLEYRAIVGSVSGATVDLQVVPPDALAQLEPFGTTSQAPYVSIVGNAITCYNSNVGNLSLTYYAKIPALSNSNTTNWLLTRAPSLYLYGALLEAAPFMMDDNRAQVWKQYFDAAVAALKSSDMGARFAKMKARVRGYSP